MDTWDSPDPWMSTNGILQFLTRLPISTTERLGIVHWDPSIRWLTEENAAYQTLLLMNNIRTLTLTDCLDVSFILALNPSRNTSNTVVCPKLEEFILYTKAPLDESRTGKLLEMVKERALRGAKLSTCVIDCPQGLDPADKVFDLGSYVSRVEHRQDGAGWGASRDEMDDPPCWWA